MRKAFSSLVVSGFALAVALFGFAPEATAAKRIVFGGGPAGGTFQVVANAVQTYGPVKDIKDFRVKAQSSAGSVVGMPAP